MLPTTQPFPELKVNTTNETYVIQGLKYFTEYSVEVGNCFSWKFSVRNIAGIICDKKNRSWLDGIFSVEFTVG